MLAVEIFSMFPESFSGRVQDLGIKTCLRKWSKVEKLIGLNCAVRRILVLKAGQLFYVKMIGKDACFPVYAGQYFGFTYSNNNNNNNNEVKQERKR